MGNRVVTVDVGEGDDLADVGQGMAAAFLQAGVVVHGRRGQGEEALEDLGIAGVPALRDQRLGVVGIFTVEVALVGAEVAGDEFVVVVQADPVGVGFEGQRAAGEAGGARVAAVSYPHLNAIDARTTADLLRLTLLEPAIIQAILAGKQPRCMSLLLSLIHI